MPDPATTALVLILSALCLVLAALCRRLARLERRVRLEETFTHEALRHDERGLLSLAGMVKRTRRRVAELEHRQPIQHSFDRIRETNEHN